MRLGVSHRSLAILSLTSLSILIIDFSHHSILMPARLDPAIMLQYRRIIAVAKYTLATLISLIILALQCADLRTNRVIFDWS